MRSLVVKLALLFFWGVSMLACSRSDKNEEPTLKQEEGENVIFNLSFENGNESFFTTRNGNNPRYRLSPIPLSPIKKVTVDKFNCGQLYIGSSDEFTSWKGYDFQGNNSTFLGLNMGACKGTFTAGATRKFTLKQPLTKTKATLEFNYYMPGDYTGWKDNDYSFKIYIYKVDQLEKPHIFFYPKINKKGWVKYSRKVARDLPVGDYYLLVQMANGSMGIDDIKLLKEE
jgi:hypothetical protein